jgi:nitroreductase
MKLKNQDTIRQNIENRRTISVAKMTDEPIDEAIVNDILAAANFAPTHKFTEPWRFFRVEGGGRKRLAECLSSSYKKMTSEESFSERKYEKLQKAPFSAPVVLGIGMKRGESVPEWEEIAAVSCAVQNMHLMATAHGLGARWSSPALCNTADVKKFFSLGEKDKCLGFFYIGHIDGELPAAHRNSGIEDKVTLIS